MMPLNSLPNDAIAARRLAVQINVCMMRVERLTYQLQTLKEELEECMQHYFSQISAHVTLGRSMQKQEFDTNPSYIKPLDDIIAKCDATDHVMRQLYRHLARACHPDIHPNAAPALMTKVNEAYHNRELGSLMLLAAQTQQHSRHMLTFTIEDMSCYRDTLQTTAEALQQQLEALLQSDANRLRQRILAARLNGGDVIADVVNALQRKNIAA